MTMLEKIYYNRDKIMENCVDSEAARKAYDELQEFFNSKGIPMSESDEYVGNVMTETEKQGFLDGFHMAVALFTNGGGAAA